MAFKDMVIGIILAGLFSMAMLTFVVQTQFDNSATNNIINDPAISSFNASLYTDLNSVNTTAQTQRNTFEQQDVTSGDDDAFGFTSIVGIVKSFLSTAVSMFNLVFSFLAQTLGIPLIVLNVVLALIIVLALILLWRLIKAGGI